MKKVDVNGIELAYTERGQGEPLILLMGLGADGSLWEDHVKAYERHFRCILLDNRGAGASDKPAGPYTTEMMAEDVAGLMDALGIPRAMVAGISMGSAIAQQLALAFPDKVQSLLLISSWARCDRYMQDVFEHFHRMRAVVSPEHFLQLLQLWIFTPAISPRSMRISAPAAPRRSSIVCPRTLSPRNAPRAASTTCWTAWEKFTPLPWSPWAMPIFSRRCTAARPSARACPTPSCSFFPTKATATIGKTWKHSIARRWIFYLHTGRFFR